MRVICIDDKNLPEGASVIEGKEYIILSEETNMMQQKIVFLKGVPNEGKTKLGFPWRGYRKERFVSVENTYKKEKEVNYMLN